MHTSLAARKDKLWFIAPISEVPLAKDWFLPALMNAIQRKGEPIKRFGQSKISRCDNL